MRGNGGVAADPLGNIFILPRQLDVGLCQGCRNIYGAQQQGDPPVQQQQHDAHHVRQTVVVQNG